MLILASSLAIQIKKSSLSTKKKEKKILNIHGFYLVSRTYLGFYSYVCVTCTLKISGSSTLHTTLFFLKINCALQCLVLKKFNVIVLIFLPLFKFLRSY